MKKIISDESVQLLAKAITNINLHKKVLLTPYEAHLQFGISQSKFEEWASMAIISHYKPTKDVILFHRADISEFLSVFYVSGADPISVSLLANK